NYAYDAFVAHSSNDRAWVVRRLLPRLETEGRYRLCVHQRDWLAGREISENIVESIETSRKVIVVLSNSFAQSRWCQVELAIASNRRLSNWRNSLVLVLLETISPENQTATMRCLLTTHTYLEWNERSEEKFWSALRKALR
ncbi:Toll-like receptor 1, partial [Lamellibrachia satsuma]